MFLAVKFKAARADARAETYIEQYTCHDWPLSCGLKLKCHCLKLYECSIKQLQMNR